LKLLETDRTNQIVAIKLFSVSPSEMCDERTASKLSAFNTAKRNGLTRPNIICMAQLQQYWNHGFSNPNYNHKARLTIPKSQTHPTTIVLPPPTLQDLLNPVPSADGPGDSDDHLLAPTTTAEEMYGATFDEGDDDESPPITFIRGVNLERLAIEAFVDLANPKLIVRFQDSPATSAPGSAKGNANDSQPPKARSSKWSEEDAQWASNGDLDW
jgi:hypothetical protein